MRLKKKINKINKKNLIYLFYFYDLEKSNSSTSFRVASAILRRNRSLASLAASRSRQACSSRCFLSYRCSASLTSSSSRTALARWASAFRRSSLRQGIVWGPSQELSWLPGSPTPSSSQRLIMTGCEDSIWSTSEWNGSALSVRRKVDNTTLKGSGSSIYSRAFTLLTKYLCNISSALKIFWKIKISTRLLCPECSRRDQLSNREGFLQRRITISI